jgi:MFS family permease
LARAAAPARGRRGWLRSVPPPDDPSDPRDPDEPTTQPVGSRAADDERSIPEPPFETRSTVVRLFGSDSFFRLWIAQVVSALGDWIGFVAIIAIAGRVGGDSAAAVSLVLSARMVPGFFLAPMAGVLVDRWDRKKVMVACDLFRAGVLCTLPFIDHVWTLVVASFLLEVGTLLWSPAKEASVPNLVPTTHLATANSLSLVAAYGTFPIAALLFAFLAKVAGWLSHVQALDFLEIDREFIAVYLDVITFCLSALLISTVALRKRAVVRERPDIRFDWGQTLRELREGWRFMFINPTVRAVMVGIGTGLVGGGMVVPLANLYSKEVLGGGAADFGLLLTGMGFGMAFGVVLVTTMQNRIPKARVFCWSVLIAGVALIGGAAMETLPATMVFVAALGVCSGSVYVLGFTILQQTVADELRGRIFAALYTLVRFCLLLSFALGPLLADTLGRLSNRMVDEHVLLAGVDIELPGVRLALWLAGLIILGAGLLAVTTLRSIDRERVDA